MAIRYYDEALVNKLKNWTSNTDVTITGPDETRRMFEVIADKTKDKPIKLPLKNSISYGLKNDLLNLGSPI